MQNQPQAMEPTSSGIRQSMPKYPQYAVMSKRLDSYKSWAEYLPIKPTILAEAGLVYTGVGDSVRCYHCGGGLRNWERGDNPWEEHAKWYPECGYIMQVKGQKFVDNVLSGSVPEIDKKESREETKGTEQKEEDPMKSIAVQSCREMGFNEDLIKQAVDIYIAKNGNNNFEGSDIATIVLELEDGVRTQLKPNCNVLDTHSTETGHDVDPETDEEVEDPETLRILTEENNRLKESMACKICLDGNKNIVFLPCGHLLSCPMCALYQVNCNICGTGINAYIKVYFAD